MPLFPEPPPDIPIGAPSASTADRFIADRLLRRQGFSIHRRKKGLPVLWVRDGKVYVEKEALQMAMGMGEQGH